MIFPFPAVLQLCGRIAFGDGELCEPTMHFHPQFSTININIDGFPIPEIRFSPTPRGDGHNSPSPKAMPIHDKYTAGINKLRLWASLVNPYCAKHNLPSPTDFQLPVPDFQHTFSDGFRFPVSGFLVYRLRRFPISRFPVFDSGFTVFVGFIANRFRVIAYPWTRIFASILPENQPPYGVLVDF